MATLEQVSKSKPIDERELSRTADFFQGLVYLAALSLLTYGFFKINDRILDNVRAQRVELQKSHFEELQETPDDIPTKMYYASRPARLWNSDNPLVDVRGGQWHTYNSIFCTVYINYVKPFDHDNDPKTQAKAYAVLSSINHCLSTANRITTRDVNEDLVVGKILKTTTLNDDYSDPTELALVEFPDYRTINPLSGNTNLDTLDQTDLDEKLKACGHPAAVNYQSLCEEITINRFEDDVILLNMISTPAHSGTAIINEEGNVVCTVKGSYNAYDPQSPTVCSPVVKSNYENISDLFMYGYEPENMIKDTKMGKQGFIHGHNRPNPNL